MQTMWRRSGFCRTSPMTCALFLSLLVVTISPAMPAFGAQAKLPAEDQRTTAKLFQAYCESCHFLGKLGQFTVGGRNIKQLHQENPGEIFKENWLTTGILEYAQPRPADYHDRVFFDERIIKESAHAKVYCVECHVSLQKLDRPFPHPQYLPPADCRGCHTEEDNLWNEGQHGKAVAANDRDAPRCQNCHSDYHAMKLGQFVLLDTTKIVETCSSCHASGEILSRHPDLKADAVPTYLETIHSEGVFEAGLMVAADCSDCHGPHRNLHHDDRASSMHLVHTLNTCGSCHKVPAALVKDTVHGQQLYAGNAEAPGCTSCHTGHEIKQVGTAEFQCASVPACGQCHEEWLKTYRLTYHGKAATHSNLDTARCQHCHGFHDVHPSSSTLSLANVANMVETCKPCHSYANEKFIAFMPHLEFHDKTHPQTYYTWLFMTILLIGTMGFFVAHSILWLIREIALLPALKKAAESGSPPMYRIQRFTLVHRITHTILFISVIGLAATGLPLRYPESQWAQTLFVRLGGVTVCGWLHRLFAALTIVYVGIHFVYLWNLWRRAPKRPFWRTVFGPMSMIPNWTDVKQFFQHLRWFLFLGPHPRFGRWTYYEKFDYWAVFWGVAIIGASGAVMALSPIVARFVPGWVFNVALIIHSDEALLAASFLFAIHFFHVHLRPLKFPMDHVMFTGSMAERELADERPDELKRLEEQGELARLRVQPPNPTQLVVNRVIAAVTLAIGLGLLVAMVWSELIVRLV